MEWNMFRNTNWVKFAVITLISATPALTTSYWGRRTSSTRAADLQQPLPTEEELKSANERFDKFGIFISALTGNNVASIMHGVCVNPWEYEYSSPCHSRW
jgi:hypothetical protein